MKAAIWYGPDEIRLEERPVPEVVTGSMLIRVKTCAICGSDLRIFQEGNQRIDPPRILGHEISGVVVALGNGVSRFKVGDRVSIGADIPCGKCVHCASGRPNCCDTNLAIGYQYDGGFAEYLFLNPLVVDLGPIQRFGDDLSFESAALAEPIACCLNGYERAHMETGRSVVIFGAGPIGLLLSLLAPVMGASRVFIIEPLGTRREVSQKTGADHVIDPSNSDPVKDILRFTDGKGADVIFTACASVETHEQAIKMVAKRGVVNLFGGLPKTERPISIMSNHLHYREAYLTGSHGAAPEHHRQAICLLEEKRINPGFLIDRTFDIESVHSAFSLAKSREVLKVIIQPHE